MRWFIGLLLFFSISKCFSIGGNEMVSARYTVQTDRVVHEVDKNIYGQFLEHILNSVHGGLWGNMILNGSVEPNPGQENLWYTDGEEIGLTRPATDNRLLFDDPAWKGPVTDNRLLFGDPAWTDYEITLDAMREEGSEGFIVMFRVAGTKDFYWCNFGAEQNTEHAMQRNRTQYGNRKKGSIETGRWYAVKIRCEGPHFQVWLDNKKILDETDEKNPVLNGKIGLNAWGTKTKFRNVKVQSLEGKELFKGVPGKKEMTARPLYWDFYGSGRCILDAEQPCGSEYAVRIENEAKSGETGIMQEPLFISKGETYSCSLYMKGEASRGVRISISDNQGTASIETTLKVDSTDWKKYEFTFTPKHTIKNAAIRIGLPGKGTVWVDVLSLYAKSALDCGGYRADLLQAIKELQPATIRYPGGCFASQYRWKDGIGSPTERTVHPHVIWDDRDMNEYGTDEFLRMCDIVGAKPVMVLNMNMGIQYALDWIEYCNGPVTSVWGSIRAKNGHPKPYDVPFWEIDNETYGMGTRKYSKTVIEFSRAIRAKYPELTIIACGSYAYDKDGWDKAIIDATAKDIDYISPHYYNGLHGEPDYKDDPRMYEAHLKKLGEYIQQSANPKIKIYVSEWNLMSTDWRAGLYAGSILNGFERIGDVVKMACPALWLRQSGARSWDNALINFDNETWFPAPNYVVMKLWRDHYGPNLLELDGSERPLNITATQSAGGKTVYIKAVNPEKYPVEAQVTLKGIKGKSQATFLLVNPGDEKARNTLEEPDTITPKAAKVSCENGVVRFRMPPLSAGVVTVE